MTVPARRGEVTVHPTRGYPVCGGRTRGPDAKYEYCTQPAGWGTDHVGQGRCKLHAGSTPRRTGRYATTVNHRVADYLEELEDDPNPLDTVQELNLLRALLRDWLDRYTEIVDALLNWNRARGERERPARVPDVTEVSGLVESISRVAYRIERARSDKYVPRAVFHRIMMAMGRVIESRVVDEDIKSQIKDDWLRIEVP